MSTPAALDHRRLLEELAARPPGGELAYGDRRVVDCLTDLSHALLQPATARAHPELAPLGTFLRRPALERALSRDPGTGLTAPRGLVFHIPPSNVDTLAVYTWALSALAGNRNVIRVPTRTGPAAQHLVSLVRQSLARAHPALAATQHFVAYGHDDTVTAALSAACDLRVLWGGDLTITALRAHPLPPRARDLTFPDRSSFAALSVDGWLAADDHERAEAAQGLYRDATWFDQDACASPRTVFWTGTDPTAMDTARRQLREHLTGLARARPPHQDPALALHQRTSLYALAAASRATALTFTPAGLAFADLTPEGPPQRAWLGVGTFAQHPLPCLADLAPLIERRDQTLTHFGYPPAELAHFATLVTARGLDRIVPLGQALTFSTVWDGYDLMREFTRTLTLTPPPDTTTVSPHPEGGPPP